MTGMSPVCKWILQLHTRPSQYSASLFWLKKLIKLSCITWECNTFLQMEQDGLSVGSWPWSWQKRLNRSKYHLGYALARSHTRWSPNPRWKGHFEKGHTGTCPTVQISKVAHKRHEAAATAMWSTLNHHHRNLLSLSSFHFIPFARVEGKRWVGIADSFVVMTGDAWAF